MDKPFFEIIKTNPIINTLLSNSWGRARVSDFSDKSRSVLSQSAMSDISKISKNTNYILQNMFECLFKVVIITLIKLIFLFVYKYYNKNILNMSNIAWCNL